MDFSPYKPSPDESRSARFQKKGKGAAYAPIPGSSRASYQSGAPMPHVDPSLMEQGQYAAGPSVGQASQGLPGGTVRVNKYETRLPIRVDIEAAFAYLLGPITGVLLIILETHNDYVRFHAWQSATVFLTLMCIHFVLMFISSTLSWLLFAFDIVLILGLSYRAYLDGASLERYELPYFGPLASHWVDTE